MDVQVQNRHGWRWFHAAVSLRNANSCLGLYKDVQAKTAERDSSGILFIAGIVQQQPSTRGEALRGFTRSNQQPRRKRRGIKPSARIKRYKRIARFLRVHKG